MKWIFRTIPRGDDYGVDSWRAECWRYSGHTNVWGNMAVDEELGYVYLPTGTPTNDWYGGMRPGDNLFAESIVCIDGDTEQRVWHFQTMHHGLWDYDFPTGANLLDITVDGRDIKAIAQTTDRKHCRSRNGHSSVRCSCRRRCVAWASRSSRCRDPMAA